MPSRGALLATAVTSTTVSRQRMKRAPLACSAMWPVSTVRVWPA